MLLIFIASMVAVLAATVFGKLANRPTARPVEEARFSWSSTSTAALFAGAFAGAAGYLGSALEEYGVFVLALAVMGPFTAAAWEQRLREARVYRPETTSALRNEDAWDNHTRDVPDFFGWGDDHTTARGNS